MKITIPKIKKLCMKVLEKNGLSKEDAGAVFEEYLDRELRGRKCHGINTFPKFAVKALKSMQNKYKIIKEHDNCLLVNGMGNKAQIILKEYLPKLIKKTKNKKIAMLGMYNAGSYLMPGTYARKLAENDLIALIFNYGGAPRICPTGSIDPVFGTNPIAVGIPSNDFPIVVDMGTSKYVMGKVRLAKKLGKLIEKEAAIDKDGNPTQDPIKAMEGALFPFGGHKGYALALVVEVLSKSLFNIDHLEKGKSNRGYLFLCIGPSFFNDISQFKSNVSGLIKQIKNSRKAEGVDEIFVPGELSERIKQENLKKGYLNIDKKIIDEIKKIAE